MEADLKTLEFIEKAKAIHGDRYDYSMSVYTKSYGKITIICKEHGEFKQTASSHLRKHGCPECGLKNGGKIHSEKVMERNVKETENFINKLIDVHGDRYDYSKVIYLHSKKNIIISCKKHGEFSQIAYTHLKGGGCPKCAGVYIRTTEEMKEDLEKKGYIVVEKDQKFIGHDKITVMCIGCGNIFETTYHNSMQVDEGRSCNKCGHRKVWSFEEVKEFFENNGCVLLSETYENNEQKLDYICSCGERSIIAFSKFKIGSRCRKCGDNKMRQKLLRKDLTEEERFFMAKNARSYIEGYVDWRNAVYKRDGYKCKKCGGRSGGLNVHHIENFHKDIKNQDPVNGITMCKKCHKGFHLKYGNKDNNAVQLVEFFRPNLSLPCSISPADIQKLVQAILNSTEIKFGS